MTLPKLILHVGTHKTGTSALQSYLSENRRLLRRDEIYYPSLSKNIESLRKTHHQIATAPSDQEAQ